MAEGEHQGGVYPDAKQKAKMIEAVEGIIITQCAAFSRWSEDGQRDTSVSDDAAQACRLRLWTAAGKFRLGGRAKWSTFAHTVVGFVVKQVRDNFFEATLRGQCHAAGRDIDFVVDAADPADDDGPADDDTDALAGSLAAVRRVMFADHLAALTPAQRRLVEMVVFDGLTLAQVADQLGQKLCIVELTFRGTVERLRAKGLIPADVAAKWGIVPRPVRPAKVWAAGEKASFHAAANSDRPAAEIAAEFGVSIPRVTSTRSRLRSQASAEADRPAELCPA